MPISTNSVVHYTDSLDKLTGILGTGFRLKYCHEQIVFQTGSIEQIATVMVSFCDIPFTEIKNHVNAYGFYGIGLTKKWAKERKLNPVFYIDADSNLANSIDDQIDQIVKSKTRLSDKLTDHILKLLGYLKNYKADLTRQNKVIKDYNFYNEREWRFVPTYDQLKGIPVDITSVDYTSNKAKHNKALEKFYLAFEPNDITYILVKTDAEIIKVIRHLRNVYSDKCSATELEILMTKIHSIDNIINDF